MTKTQSIILPDTLAKWPWQRRLNCFHDEVKKEAQLWARSFRMFTPKAQEAFDRGAFELFASLLYPSADRARLRSGCDLMNLFFLFDEYSDVASEVEVRVQKEIIMDALRDTGKLRPPGEWIGGEVARSFWELASQTATPSAQKRFINIFEEYLEAVVQQAADRGGCYQRDIISYLEVRRCTVGVKPALVLYEFDLDLPDEVFENPFIQEVSFCCVEIAILTNDMYSYNVEQARGDESHNIVAAVMNELGTDIAGAMEWVKNYSKELEIRFMESFKRVPRFGGPIDLQIARYCDCLGYFVRANDQWCFESERYFGKKGAIIQKTREVNLLPRIVSNGGIGPQVVDELLL